MDTLHVADAIDEIFTLLRRANKYIDETTPWILGKDPEKAARLNSVLYELCETIRVCAILLGPFLPDTSKRILSQFNLTDDSWESITGAPIPEGHELNQPEILFARIDPKEKTAQIEKLLADAAAKQAKPETKEADEITIEDFQKLDLCAGKILSCEPVTKSDKLLVMQIDLGDVKRQIVSGIHKWYEPEDLIGKTVVVVRNLKPVKLRGVESQGMILSAELADGSARVLFTDAEAGSRVR
jgi:methionyl-tRNA synthetase